MGPGAILAPQRCPGQSHSRNQTFENCHNIGESSFFYNGGGSQVMDQEFSKMGLSQGSGGRSPPEAEAKCEISVHF